MTTKRVLGFAILGVGVLALIGYFLFRFRIFQASPRATLTVPITNCKPDPEPVPVHYQDQVSWVGDPNYTITFADPPFTSITSGVPFPVQHASGGVKALVQLGCYIKYVVGATCDYKYSILGGSGCPNDPHVIITP